MWFVRLSHFFGGFGGLAKFIITGLRFFAYFALMLEVFDISPLDMV